MSLSKYPTNVDKFEQYFRGQIDKVYNEHTLQNDCLYGLSTENITIVK